MNTTPLIICSLAVSLTIQTAAAADATEKNTGKAAPDRGLTLEGIGRGLKSAVQNIESEIPKIGPAIGDTVKKVTGKESEKQPSSSPSKEKK